MNIIFINKRFNTKLNVKLDKLSTNGEFCMETVLTPGSQNPGMVVTGHHDNNKDCYGELILNSHMSNESHNVQRSVESFGSLNLSSVERFGLKSLEEICDVKKSMAEYCGEIQLKIADEGCKTRDLIQKIENDRLRDEVSRLRLQLATGSTTPV